MSSADQPKLIKSIGFAIREYVNRAMLPVEQRFKEFEERILSIPSGPSGPSGQPGADGRDADPELVRQLVAEHVKIAIQTIPIPKDGADGPPGNPGKDGVSPSMDDIIKAVTPYIPAPMPGPAGQSGASIQTGEGPPLFTSKAGDIYIDIKTGDLYRSC